MASQRIFKDMISGPVRVMKTTLVNIHFVLGSLCLIYHLSVYLTIICLSNNLLSVCLSIIRLSFI